MRGDVVYRVYALHEGREKDYFFGAFRSVPEADARIAELRSREMNGRNWAEQYHNKGFVILEVRVETEFDIPTLPKPREKYVVKCSPKSNGPGVWPSTTVEVLRRTSVEGGVEKVCEYERSHSMFQTFEPFRQGDKEFALISRDYTKTAVLDLESGDVIAEEADEPDSQPGSGFCPVGFYVPDWWDLQDGSIIPGSEYWNADCEWPRGDFGFVWGCHWGDDSFWKVQHLDLSRVQQGVITRTERFGYVELATTGYLSPCLTSNSATATSSKPHFIRVSRYKGVMEVTFAVEMRFDLTSGKANEWQRLSVHDFE